MHVLYVEGVGAVPGTGFLCTPCEDRGVVGVDTDTASVAGILGGVI